MKFGKLSTGYYPSVKLLFIFFFPFHFFVDPVDVSRNNAEILLGNFFAVFYVRKHIYDKKTNSHSHGV